MKPKQNSSLTPGIHRGWSGDMTLKTLGTIGDYS